MRSQLFADSMLEVLPSPGSWEIISTAFPFDRKPVEHPEHAAWMAGNSHSHPHQELLLILKGEGYQGFCDNVYSYSPGTIFLFDSYEKHDFYYPEWASNTDHLWLGCFQNHIVYSLIHIERGRPEYIGHTVLSQETPSSWTHGLDTTGKLHPALVKLRVYSQVSSLIATIIESSLARAGTANSPISFQEQIVLAIQEHIEQTSGKGINLDVLARLSGYSKFHFERIFKQHTGLSVHKYINECRRTRAESMLKQGYLRKQIAHALGFSALSAFSRWYGQEAGDRHRS